MATLPPLVAVDPTRRPAMRALPPVTVVGGSLLVALVPAVAASGWMPPLGLLVLLAWRLLAPGALRPWAAAPLGLVDDLVSGQPLGSAVLLWSLAFLAVDLVERRLLFRGFLLDWLLAAVLAALVLVAGRFIASPAGTAVDGPLGAQLLASALLFPLVARACAWVDRRRSAAA